jgi:2-polyprenyl-3-methyl-5-hydroxy-6-metoxy-1,4-benzoquinol methylase
MNIFALKHQETNKQFIKFIYQLLLQRSPDEGGFNHWLNALNKGSQPMEFINSILSSDEFAVISHKNKTINPAINIKNQKNTLSFTETDKLDTLHFDLTDDWKKFEDIINQQHITASSDINNILKSIYLNKDRAEAFDRFKQSYEFQYIHHLLTVLGIDDNKKICEVGGGAGYLTWALSTSNYRFIDLFEPNPTWISGVGYLKSRDDATEINIHTDLHEWHTNNKLYDVIITKACIHHFGNISQVAASIRQKIQMGGRWVALREQFADTPAELVTLLAEHDYCQEFKLYEWAYPAATYIEAMEMVGLRLTAIVPAFYANDCIGTNLENKPTPDSLAFTAEIDDLLRTSPEITVERFWEEHHARRNGFNRPLQYTRPQAMIFEKVLVS